jgi:hypothetical protein
MISDKFIAFSTDIDWACDEVIIDLLNIFEENNIKLTIFSTHATKVLDKLNEELFEIALHPNFNYLLNGYGKNAEEIMNDMCNIYPDAKGIRSHFDMHSYSLCELFKQKGLMYESNIFLPYNNNIKPFVSWNGLYQIPFNWEDDIHFLYNKSFENSGLNILDDNIIFNFHPIHVFLNSENQERYLAAKPYYTDYNKLKDFINKSDTKGSRDLLLKTINEVLNNNIKTYKLLDIVK